MSDGIGGADKAHEINAATLRVLKAIKEAFPGRTKIDYTTDNLLLLPHEGAESGMILTRSFFHIVIKAAFAREDASDAQR